MAGKFIYWDTVKSSFVKKDLNILRSKYKVVDYTFNPPKKSFLPLFLIGQLIRSFITIPFADAVISQFSGYHSFFPFAVARLFRKPRIIVAGGTDCVSFPSIQYGNFNRKYLKWFTRKSFEYSTLILPVAETLIYYRYTYNSVEGDPKEQGYRVFVKKIKARETVIHNGYDEKIWFPRQSVKRKSNSFITVGANLHSRFAFKLKGIDLFIDLARKFPESEFAIIGGQGLSIDNCPPNLVLLPNSRNEDLPEIYSAYEFYLQLSISEGFPNALTEAMFCGCRPIVSNAGGMPEIVADPEAILAHKDIIELVELVTRNINSTDNTEERMRRIRSEYSIENRKQKLLNEIALIIAEYKT
ncbi:MAG: glycosyltransferase family 4 protein, partial [Bacteroidia bacterium]